MLFLEDDAMVAFDGDDGLDAATAFLDIDAAPSMLGADAPSVSTQKKQARQGKTYVCCYCQTVIVNGRLTQHISRKHADLLTTNTSAEIKFAISRHSNQSCRITRYDIN
jgi:hypothetical protein